MRVCKGRFVSLFVIVAELASYSQVRSLMIPFPFALPTAYYRQMSWAQPEQFAAITVPCLVLHGASDKIFPVAAAEALAVKVANSDPYPCT